VRAAPSEKKREPGYAAVGGEGKRSESGLEFEPVGRKKKKGKERKELRLWKVRRVGRENVEPGEKRAGGNAICYSAGRRKEKGWRGGGREGPRTKKGKNPRVDQEGDRKKQVKREAGPTRIKKRREKGGL